MVKNCVESFELKIFLNGWVDGWMGGLKLNYNGGPFSKMLGFLKIKFLIILKLNYNGGQFYKK